MSMAKKFKTAFIILFCFIMLFAQTGYASTGTNEEMAKKMDELLNMYTKDGYFSGSVLVAKNGRIILEKGYGMANYELNVPNKPETVFKLGSITKQFTAMAIMQLQEKGLLSVNDTVSKYISDFPNGSKVTIHQLLTHSSGIMDYINDDRTFSKTDKVADTKSQTMNRFKDRPLLFKPGTRYSYSNTGYFLLGCIIEKVSGKTYEEYLNENIFKPLNMKNTGVDHTDKVIKDRAAGYGIANGKLVNAEFTEVENFFGCGDIYSTVEDLYLWDRALNTEKLVSKKSLDAMFTNYQFNYGYGFKIPSSGKYVYHTGRINGFDTYIARFPSTDGTIIILSNNWMIPFGNLYTAMTQIMLGQKYVFPKFDAPLKMDMQ